MTDQDKPEDSVPEEESSRESSEEPQQPAGEPESTEPVKGATVAKEGAAGSGDSTGSEPPYIDDRVSKWWVGIIVAVFVLIFAAVILFGRSGLLGDIFEDDGAAATPSPAPNPSPSQ